MQNNTPSFMDFWNTYDYKRDRYLAEKAWKRLSDDDKRKAISAIPAYRDDCIRRNIPMVYGVRYLTHRRWEDEYDATETPTPVAEHKEQQTHMEEW